MKGENPLLIVGLVLVAMLAIPVLANTFSARAPENNPSPIVFAPSVPSGYSNSGVSIGYTDPNHYSIQTKMSLQGKVTDFI